jgi:hypothetical protein
MLLTLAANSFRVVLERGNMVLVLPYISHDMEVSRICEMLSSVDCRIATAYIGSAPIYEYIGIGVYISRSSRWRPSFSFSPRLRRHHHEWQPWGDVAGREDYLASPANRSLAEAPVALAVPKAQAVVAATADREASEVKAARGNGAETAG